MLIRYLLSAAMLTATIAAPAAAASSVTNVATSGSITAWGPGSSQSYGLAFTASDVVLNDFSLTVSGSGFAFVTQVYAWTGTATTGAALYTSGTALTTSALKTFTYTPNLTVTAGNRYIAFVTNQPGGVSLGGTGTGGMAIGTGPATFYYNSNSPAVGNWSPYSLNAAFNADFSTSAGVPEPASWALLITGFALTGVTLRRRATSAAV